MPSRTETRIDADDTGVTIGVDVGSFSAGISTSGILSIGIGVAEVNLNLKNLQESEINYAFGLYSIEGEQDGCTVILRYYIAGQLAQTETRTIPECDQDEDDQDDNNQDEDDQDDNNETPSPRKNVGWYGTGYACIAKNYFSNSYREVRSSVTGQFLASRSTYEETVYKCTTIASSSKGKLWSVTYKSKSSLIDIYATFLGAPNREIYNTYESPPSYIYSNREFAGEYLSQNPNAPPFNFLMQNDHPVDLGEEAQRLNDLSQRSSGGWFDNDSRIGVSGGGSVTGVGYAGFSSTSEWLILDATKPNILKQLKQPPPYKEKMDENCCDKINEIYEVLGIKEMQDKGFIIPNRMIAPNAKGNTKLETFVDIYEWQVRQTDHLGIHPFKAIVQDYNAAQKGDQKLELQMVNATAFAKTITELLLENKGDAATRLNLMIRTAIAVGQILNVVSIGAKRTREVMRFLGVPVKEKTFDVKMPFDFSFGQRQKKGKGFATGVNQKGVDALGINTEKATEELLPEFMKDEEQPIIVEMFDDSQPNLVDLIQKLLGRK